MYRCTCVYVYVYMYVCMYVCLYVFLFVCMYVYIEDIEDMYIPHEKILGKLVSNPSTENQLISTPTHSILVHVGK